jgi:adenylate cyclase
MNSLNSQSSPWSSYKLEVEFNKMRTLSFLRVFLVFVAKPSHSKTGALNLMPTLSEVKRLMQRKPDRHEATVLFCDIRGFSSLFDEKDPMDAIDFANTVLEKLGLVVEACNGYLDKFTGDGFLAHFGVLEETSKKQHMLDACWCAIRMREELAKLNQTRHASSMRTVNIGVGIHSGKVASGVLSTNSRVEFTIMGSVVNTASRIETLTKEFMVDCLVTQKVYEFCRNDLEFKPMPKKPLKGVKHPPLTYWISPVNLFSY